MHLADIEAQGLNPSGEYMPLSEERFLPELENIAHLNDCGILFVCSQLYRLDHREV
jgi:hypothetical protein